jgi:hypothetical protein
MMLTHAQEEPYDWLIFLGPDDRDSVGLPISPRDANMAPCRLMSLTSPNLEGTRVEHVSFYVFLSFSNLLPLSLTFH